MENLPKFAEKKAVTSPETDVQKQEMAIKLAREALAKTMKPNPQRILLKIEQVQGHPDLWEVDFGIPNVADSNVLITVDLKKQTVIDFKVMAPQ